MKTLTLIKILIFLTIFTLSGYSNIHSYSVKSESSLFITNPKGLENWKVDSVVSINWMINNSTDKEIDFIKLEYTIDNGKTWKIILYKVPAILGNYMWKIPKEIFEIDTSLSKIKSKGNVFARIRISNIDDTSSFDVSNIVNITKPKVEDKTTLHALLFGAGDFISAFSPKKDTASNSKTTSITNGTVGVLLTDSLHWNLSVGITIVSSSDTVVDNYGSSILSPKKGTASLGLNLTWMPFSKLSFLTPLGFYLNMNASDGLWGYDTISTYRENRLFVSYVPGNKFTVKSINYAFSSGFLLSYRGLLKDKVGVSTLGVYLSFGTVLRQVLGDVKSLNGGLVYNRLMNTNQSTFFGFQWGAKIIFNNFALSLSMLNLFATNDRPNVIGLTTNQLLLNFEFKTMVGIFDIKF